MKKIIFIFAIFAISFYFHACDSPTQTRATNPLVPEPLLPYNGSTNVSLTPLFKWKHDAHKLHISEHQSFSTLKVNATVTGTQYQLGENEVLTLNTRYYWRVGVVSGSTTVWSQNIYTFVTQ